jgi:hypothetical protein
MCHRDRGSERIQAAAFARGAQLVTRIAARRPRSSGSRRMVADVARSSRSIRSRDHVMRSAWNVRGAPRLAGRFAMASRLASRE